MPNKSEAELLFSQGSDIKLGGHGQHYEGACQSYHPQQWKWFSGPMSIRSAQRRGHITAWISDIRKIGVNQPDVKVIMQNFLGENTLKILQTNLPSCDQTQLVVDVLHLPEERKTMIFVRPRVDSKSTHGTGCTLSSAIFSSWPRDRPICSFVPIHSDSRNLKIGLLV